MKKVIYTDQCCDHMIYKIKKELNLDILLRMSDKDWTLSDAMSIITTPEINLTIINRIDEISVIEMGLLHFLCKPILVTVPLRAYPTLETKIVDYIDSTCNLTDKNSNFITWYRNFYEETIN